MPTMKKQPPPKKVAPVERPTMAFTTTVLRIFHLDYRDWPVEAQQLNAISARMSQADRQWLVDHLPKFASNCEIVPRDEES